MNNKKQLMLSIGLVLVLVLMIVGISYAAFQFAGPGSKVSTITSGIMKMSYTESDNIINLQGALPTTDETGKKRLNEGEYFDFTVSSTIQGNANINWEIALEPMFSENMFNPDLVKVYLTELDDAGNETQVVEPTIFTNLDMDANEYTGKPASVKGTVEGIEDTIEIPILTLYSTSTNKSFSKKYRLRMWVDESYNPQEHAGSFQFGTKVNVYGKVYTPPTVAEKLLAGVGDNGTIDTSDSEQTFITGTDPNNYIWYSGKLWRAVSIDTSDNSVKLVTQWNISALPYNRNYTTFKNSVMEQWLNDTSVDGFLGNLREPDKFIKTDSVWNATTTTENTKPEKTTMITDTVGLLNMYEYTMSYKNATYETGYLNNNLFWWTLTPYNDTSSVRYVDHDGKDGNEWECAINGSRPSINLKSTVKIIDGDGTSINPYRLQGDNDEPVGVLLSKRYSGEYINFGTGENNLYRIVSHENGTGTKITSAISLKDRGSYKKIIFGSDNKFSKDNTIGIFLNNDYLTSGTYLTSNQISMIEDNTTWYLGTVGGIHSLANYKLAKYQDAASNNLTTATTTVKIGLLRLGELMAGQFNNWFSNSNSEYWLLTPYDTSYSHSIDSSSIGNGSGTKNSNAIRPTMNLKSNVVITGGKGTKEEPFTIKLGS